MFGCQFVFAGNSYGLVVGIDDYPQVRKLIGSVRDASLVANLMENNGFTEVRRLTNNQASRQAIMAAFTYFQNKVKPGDNFYFYFSGHGTVFPDKYSDERDELDWMTGSPHPETGKPLFPRGKYDVAICPVDHKLNTSGKRWGNNILDDELFTEFAKFAAKDCFSYLISDSCYSGTLGRNTAQKSYRFILPEEAYDAPKVGVTTPSGQNTPEIIKFTTAESRARKLQGKFIALTSAGDSELALEHYFDSVSGEMGIFTYYLLEILKDNPKISFAELIPKLDGKVKMKNNSQSVQIEKRFFQGDLTKIGLLP